MTCPEWIWTLRLRLAHWLVGDRTFVANVDIVGSFITRKWTDKASIVKDIGVWTSRAEYWGTKQLTDDKQSADFVDGFSAALQAAECVIWRLEDDAFLYDIVSDAMQAVIGELRDMERNWTGRVSMVHRSELLSENERLREALTYAWDLVEEANYSDSVMMIKKDRFLSTYFDENGLRATLGETD